MDFWKEFLLCMVLLWIIYKLVMRLLRKITVSYSDDKYVFITGCDTGFGHHLALQLDDLGYHVIAGCYTEKGEVELKKKASSILCTVHVDVTKTDSIKTALEFVKNTLPSKSGLWSVVSNAGVPAGFFPVEWYTRAEFNEVLEVNTLGMMDVTTQFLPLVRKAKGRIVLVTSCSGYIGLPGFSSYCASKYAVEAFGDCLRREMSLWGVHVSIIEPGTVSTGLFKNIVKLSKKQYNSLPTKLQQNYGEQYIKFIEKGLTFGAKLVPSDTGPVVDAMSNAVTSLFPQTRYTMGLDAHLMRIISYFPDCVSDFILQSAMVKVNLPHCLQKKS